MRAGWFATAKATLIRLRHLLPQAGEGNSGRHACYSANCSLRIRSSSPCSGSNNSVTDCSRDSRMRTSTTSAHLVRIRGRADRPLVRIENVDAHLGGGRKDRAAPAPWAERTQRRDREQVRSQRQDRAVRREVVRGGTCGRRDDDAVAHELLDFHRPVERDAQVRDLLGLAQQRDLVERERVERAAAFSHGFHRQRVAAASLARARGARAAHPSRSGS